MAPAHPHATRVAVYPALFSFGAILTKKEESLRKCKSATRWRFYFGHQSFFLSPTFLSFPSWGCFAVKQGCRISKSEWTEWLKKGLGVVEDGLAGKGKDDIRNRIWNEKGREKKNVKETDRQRGKQKNRQVDFQKGRQADEQTKKLSSQTCWQTGTQKAHACSRKRMLQILLYFQIDILRTQRQETRLKFVLWNNGIKSDRKPGWPTARVTDRDKRRNWKFSSETTTARVTDRESIKRMRKRSSRE